jgi:formate hydrogenlyase transcriptional activator
VERAVILSQDSVLPNPLPKKRMGPFILNVDRPQSFQSWRALEDSDRALIVETLERVGWVVGGPRGAAAKLGLKRTTLLAKMRRLGISRPIPQQEADMGGMMPEGIEPEMAASHSLNGF